MSYSYTPVPLRRPCHMRVGRGMVSTVSIIGRRARSVTLPGAANQWLACFAQAEQIRSTW